MNRPERNRLEEVRARDTPLCRAVDAALRHIDWLEAERGERGGFDLVTSRPLGAEDKARAVAMAEEEASEKGGKKRKAKP